MSEHKSDCATNNGPAFEPGACDCDADQGDKFEPKKVTDVDLAYLNNLTAVADNAELIPVCPNIYNAIICEVQAWRRLQPGLEFKSGPNVIRPCKD